MPLANAGARRNPIVGRIDDLLEIEIGDDVGRQVMAGTQDL